MELAFLAASAEAFPFTCELLLALVPEDPLQTCMCGAALESCDYCLACESAFPGSSGEPQSAWERPFFSCGFLSKRQERSLGPWAESFKRESADAVGLEFPGENANMQQRIFSVSGGLLL